MKNAVSLVMKVKISGFFRHAKLNSVGLGCSKIGTPKWLVGVKISTTFLETVWQDENPKNIL